MNTYGEQLISHLNEILSIITTLFIFAALIPVYLLFGLVNIKTTAELTRSFTHLSKYIYGYKYTWLHLVDMLL